MGLIMNNICSPDEYIKAVENEISWNRAKKIASQEILDHIDDNICELIDLGYDHDSAVCLAIKRMGSPQEVGMALNKVYKPSWDPFLIGVIVLLSGLGLLSSNIYSLFGNMPYIISGILICIVFAFLDYSVIFKYGKYIYLTWHIVTAGVLFFDLIRNQYNNLAQYYSFYLIIVSVVAQVGIIERIISQDKWYYFICLYLPFIEAIMIKSPSAVFMICVTSAILLLSIKNNNGLIGIKRWSIILNLILLGIFVIVTILYMVNGYKQFGTQLLNISKVLREIPFWGRSNSDLMIKYTESIVKSDHPLTLFVSKFGIGVLIPFFTALILLALALFKLISRQKTLEVKMLVLVISLNFCLQIIVSFCSDIGFFSETLYIAYPLFAEGRAMTIFNYMLFGLCMSVVRNEKIATGLMSQKVCCK